VFIGGSDFHPPPFSRNGNPRCTSIFVRAKTFFLFSVRPYSASLTAPRLRKSLAVRKLARQREAKLAE
jgi:hypothetical protein